jgi:chromosome segregation ATPase
MSRKSTNSRKAIEMNNLENQRAALVNELEELECNLPALEADWQAARRKRHGVSHPMQSDPSSREAMEKVSNANSRLEQLRREIQQLDQVIELLAQAAAADQQIQAAIQAITSADSSASALRAKCKQLTAKVAILTTEIAEAQAAAEAVEASAAQALASASDEKADKAARVQLEKATELAVASEASIRLKQRAIDALGTELQSIEQELEQIALHRREAEQDAGTAALVKLSELWNQQASELAAIGTLLVAADRLIGGRLELLSDLNLPLLGSKRGDRLDRHGLLDQAEERGHSISDFVSA